MIHSLVVLRRAWDDIRKIMRWLNRHSPSGMTRWRDALDDCMNEVVHDPHRFERATEKRLAPYNARQALFHTRRGNTYRVVFLIAGNEVRVLRIRGPGQRNLRERDFH